MKEKLIQTRNQLIENIKNVYQDMYQLSFLTGSLSGDHPDALSDIDVWLVVDEEKINDLIKKRFDHYNQIGKIVHFCEPPHHSPINGMASTVIYNTDGILTEVDYYICSDKVAKFIKNAKVLFGEVNIPEGFPENNTEKRILPETYRLDFFLFLAFVAVKKTYRNDKKYLDMFSDVYKKLKTDYNLIDLPEIENNYDFDTLKKYLKAVEPKAIQKQKSFIDDIGEFIKIIHMKTNHHSYGIIPFYKKDNKIFICCVHNEKSDEWGLPKGTPEENETPFETAKRELKEETGISNFEIFGGKTFLEEYSFEQDGLLHYKQNTYYLGLVNEMKEKSQDIDSKDMKWINVKEADNFFKFENIKEVIKELVNYVNKFPLVNEYHGRSGETVLFEYFESDSLEHLPREQLSQVVIMAFHKNKLLIVNNVTKPGYYSPVGGSIEKDETPEEAVHRETKEESNMKVLYFKMIGYQKSTNQTRPTAPIEYQLRYVAIVEPYGPFEGDPDGDVTELLEIDPVDYKQYFDWGMIGEVIMSRALELKNKLI